MIKCIQVNINHCEAAQDLLKQTVREQKVDVALISELYKIPVGDGNWVEDGKSKAAIWTCSDLPFERKSNRQYDGFVYAKVNGVHFYSCYIPPSVCLEDFKETLDRLVVDANGKRPIIVAGDFNAWAVEWGSKRTTPNGAALLEAFESLNLVLLNRGSIDTFSRGGASSIIDITFASSTLSKDVQWCVSSLYTHSDHRAIIFETCSTLGHESSIVKRKAQQNGWIVKNLDINVVD
jgi:hypothetical protein